MEDFWSRYIEPSDRPGPEYWNYFAERLADLAGFPKDAAVLGIGACDGNVLFKAVKDAVPVGRGYSLRQDSNLSLRHQALRMGKSGQFLIAAALALEYGFRDGDGKQPRPLTVNQVS